MTLRLILSLTPKRNVGRYFLLILAIGCLGVFSYAYLSRSLYQTYQSWEFDRTQDHSAAPAITYSNEIIPVGRVARASRESVPPSKSPSSIDTIGRLSVPRLHLSVMVREGIDRHTLQLAVGHIPATALPGQAGNIGLAGHRDTFFRPLKDARARDIIHFSTARGDFQYEVESLMVVEPDNVEVLAPSSENMLTMVTCYPFSYIGTAPRRLVVRARQVSFRAQAPSIME